MTQIVIISKKPVLVPEGRLPAGVPIEVDPLLARFLVERGEAQYIERKTDPVDPVEPKRRGRKAVAE